MRRSLLVVGLLSLIACAETFFFQRRPHRRPFIDRDNGKHILSLTMCLAHMSGMNNNFKMVDTSPVTDESSGLDKPDCKTNGVKYRTITGVCNNILRPSEGEALSRFKRYVKPNYRDGIGAPRVYSARKYCRRFFWGKIRCYNKRLPSARTVSCAIHPPRKVTSIHSVMLMQWGQFLDHDITATAVQQPDAHKAGDDCCKHHYIRFGKLHPDSLKRNGRCFPIRIVQWPADPAFKSNCFDFVRSRPVNPAFTRSNPREQQNLLSSFVDGSNVYGSNEETVRRLRDSKNGKMKTSSGDLLPRGNDDSCILPKNKFCFDAGDERVNVFPGLTALHTVFVRLHNYIVTDFTKHNRRWNEERLFQEARKIVGAILQRITYTEFLPEVLSDATMNKYKLKEGNNYQYNSRVNPSIASVFATAAFRYGHSLIPDFLVIDGKPVKSRLLFNNPEFIFTSLKSVVENILSNPAELRDRFMSSETTEHLFEQQDGPFDLAAFNIQRGRDHGLPSYNAFRKLCKLSPVTKLTSPLSDVYSSADDVDVFAGGMVEENLPGSELGPLFNCIVGMQFSDLKFGDSFWYETKDKSRGFTNAQLRAIKNVSLSQILCQVLDLVDIQKNPFRTVTKQNKKIKCKRLKGLKLSPWYEH